MAADVDLLVVGALLLLKNETTSPLLLAAVALLASGGSSHTETATVGTLGELLQEVLPKVEQPLLFAPTFLRLPDVPIGDL